MRGAIDNFGKDVSKGAGSVGFEVAEAHEDSEPVFESNVKVALVD